MTEGRMLGAYGSVQVNSFVFERTFSCRTPFPYSPTNSRITASRLLPSSSLPVPWSSSFFFGDLDRRLREGDRSDFSRRLGVRSLRDFDRHLGGDVEGPYYSRKGLDGLELVYSSF